MHQPVINYLVLSLQCGKAAAVLVTRKHRDSIAKVRKCGSRSLDHLFLYTVAKLCFSAVEMISAGTYVPVYFLETVFP